MARRDRLLLLAAIAEAVLTLLGAAEACQLDRYLKASTRKSRELSLFNQGAQWWRLLPTMREADLGLLIPAFEQQLAQHPVFAKVFGTL